MFATLLQTRGDREAKAPRQHGAVVAVLPDRQRHADGVHRGRACERPPRERRRRSACAAAPGRRRRGVDRGGAAADARARADRRPDDRRAAAFRGARQQRRADAPSHHLVQVVQPAPTSCRATGTRAALALALRASPGPSPDLGDLVARQTPDLIRLAHLAHLARVVALVRPGP